MCVRPPRVTAAEPPPWQVARSALSYMLYQAEPSTQCPETMTFASVPVLQRLAPASRQRCKHVPRGLKKSEAGPGRE